jgi:hypothetical protein
MRRPYSCRGSTPTQRATASFHSSPQLRPVQSRPIVPDEEANKVLPSHMLVSSCFPWDACRPWKETPRSLCRSVVLSLVSWSFTTLPTPPPHSWSRQQYSSNSLELVTCLSDFRMCRVQTSGCAGSRLPDCSCKARIDPRARSPDCNAGTDWILGLCEPMFDGSAHPKTLKFSHKLPLLGDMQVLTTFLLFLPSFPSPDTTPRHGNASLSACSWGAGSPKSPLSSAAPVHPPQALRETPLPGR